MCTDPIILPDAPHIAGLSLRSIRGEQEAEALHAAQRWLFGRDIARIGRMGRMPRIGTAGCLLQGLGTLGREPG